MYKIAVLMSTYNGGEYIATQIKSIYRQNYKDFELIIRDDGSAPEFREKLRALKEKYGFRLIEGENAGFLKSFRILLEQETDAELFAFSDQDDKWLPDKLRRAADWYEEHLREDVPQLFHGAYVNVDSDTGRVTEKFCFPETGYDFRRSITENHYSGFAMVVNRRMKEMMLQADFARVDYHDWWAGMIAHAFGEAYSDKKVTAGHRVHGDNVTTFNIRTRMKWLLHTLRTESDIRARCTEFLNCYGALMREEDKKMLCLFTDEKYNLPHALKKAFYPRRWRPLLSSELVMRFLMLLGRV